MKKIPEEEGSWASRTEIAPLVGKFAVMQAIRDAEKGVHSTAAARKLLAPVGYSLIRGIDKRRSQSRFAGCRSKDPRFSNQMRGGTPLRLAIFPSGVCLLA